MSAEYRVWRMGRGCVIAGAVALVLVAACRKDKPQFAGQIIADGSSTVLPLTSAVADDFRKANPGLTISVSGSGTVAGFEKFCRGETDIQNASRPIDDRERAACEAHAVTFIEVPVAYDALTVVVHPSNTWATSMTVAELRKLWEPAAQNKVVRWADIRAGWPEEPVHLFGPGRASGTFEYFTEVVVGTPRASRTDYAADEDHKVIAAGVAGDRLALGYLGYGYFHQAGQSLHAVSIDSQSGTVALGPIAPAPDTVRRGIYQPLSRTLFVYLNGKSLDRQELLAFVDFYLKQDEAVIARVGGIGMSSRAYELVRQRVKGRVAGTLFADRTALNRNLELVLSESR